MTYFKIFEIIFNIVIQGNNNNILKLKIEIKFEIFKLKLKSTIDI